MTVEEEPQIVLEARQHDVLVARIAGEDDFVGVDVIFGEGGNAFGFQQAAEQNREHDRRHAAQQAAGSQLGSEQIGAPQRHARVDDAEQHGGAHQAQVRHQDDGK